MSEDARRGVWGTRWGPRVGMIIAACTAVVAPTVVTHSIAAAVTLTVLDRPVVASADDAEESSTGSVSLTSTDLELVNDGSDQTVGIRFTALAIPQGAAVTNAWVQFEVDEVSTASTTLQVRAQATDTAPAFVKSTANLSSRSRTSSFATWTPAAWPTIQVAGLDQRTPDLTSIIQEVVSRPGWLSGNAIAILITGTGRRTAEAIDGTRAPVLHLEYVDGAPPANRAPTVSAGLDQVVTLPASAVLSGQVGDDGLPVGATVTTQWTEEGGPGIATFGDPTATVTTVSFDGPGLYQLRLTASDTELSAADDVLVNVVEDGAPVTALEVSPASGPVPLGVTADASASTDIDATPIATYTFDFADGSTPITQASSILAHVYASVGSFTPTVTVTDTGGKASTAIASVTSTAAPPVDACLTQTPLRVITGVQTSRFKSTVTGHLAVDARTAGWTQVSDTPVSVSGTGSLCWDGGSIVGTYPSSTSWDTFHHTTAFGFANPNSVIDNLRAQNYGDGINVRSGANDWRVQAAHTTFLHDDCLQDDYLYGGVIADSLFDGCYVGISALPSSSNTASDGRSNIVTLQGTLLRLQPMPTVYKGTAPGHGGFFKWDDTARAPKLSLHDNVFRVDQPPNHGTLNLPPGYQVSCSGNTIVWLGVGAFPGAASWLTSCPDTRIVTTQSTWDDAVTLWLAAH